VDTLDLKLCPVCGCERGSNFFPAPDRFHRRDKYYQLVRCPVCSLVWLHDAPSPEEMSYHYGADYHKAITTAGEISIDKRWQYARKRVRELKQNGVLLDIGCSSGGFLQSVKSADWKLYGVEISPVQAQRAEAISGAQVFVGSILDAPFSASSFDVITGFHVLEHVYQPKAVVEKLWEWLKPEGILYLHVPNIEALDARIFRSYWYGLELPRHLYHFSQASLRRLFAPFDFDEVLLRTLSYTHIEESLHYVLDDIQAKFGMAPTPRPIPGIMYRIFRKAWRLGLLEPLGYLAAAGGGGSGIEIMLRKRVSSKRTPELQ